MTSLAPPAHRGFSLQFHSTVGLLGSKHEQTCAFRIFTYARVRCKHKLSSSELAEVTPKAEGKSSRQRARKHQLKYQSLALYRSRLALALQAELNMEQLEIKERLRKWPRQKLEAEGVALFDLHVQQEGSLYKDKVLKFYSRLGDGMLPLHNQFSQGDIVVMSRKDPLAEEDSVIEGVVLERARRFVKLAVPFHQCKATTIQGRWRLDLFANRVAYERCIFAVGIFSSPLVQQQGPVCHLEINEKMRKSAFGWLQEDEFKFGEGASCIRELLLKFQELGMHKLREDPESFSKKEEGHGASCSILNAELSEKLKALKRPPSLLGGKNLGNAKNQVRSYLQTIGEVLNSSQKDAIQTAALQKVTLWQGPPGTGKTKTLTHLVAALCERGETVLACADSNVAVDNLVEGLLERGLSVARVGQPVKVKEELREWTVDAQVAKHPLMKKVLERRSISTEQMRHSRQINNDKRRAKSVKDSKLIWESSEELEARAVADVLTRADVVACTCIGAGDEILLDRSFSVCVIDEATQATEPATLVPILMSGAHMLVLVGDPSQLPPTVVSSEAMMAGLDVSLYQRLQKCGMNPCFLDTQYRMHPDIAALPSKLFYSGKVKSYFSMVNRTAPQGFPWPDATKPLVFMDCVDGREESSLGSASWCNHAEATQVVKVLQKLKSGDDICEWEEIGVIAPYIAQVRLLIDLLLSRGSGEYQRLEIKTVDGFQGREKEVIVFSTVRANSEGNLGFVSDPRRMNVALTRAKRGLIVVGNSQTLMCDKNWSNWLTEMKKQRLYQVAQCINSAQK